MSNLLTNAIKFTPQGGRVSLRLSRHQREVVLEVVDTGRGIYPEDLPHVFERFYRGQGTLVDPGTGLGLYIVRTLVEAHGGSVEVESELDRGSTFRVRLPLEQEGGSQ